MNSRLVNLSIGCLVFLMLIAIFPVFMFTVTNASGEPVKLSSPSEGDSFKPTVTKPAGVDQDNNGIADSLDKEIAERKVNGTAQDILSVTVMLKSEPTNQDVDDFVSSGGELTTDLWTKATHGFGGKISYGNVTAFAQNCPSLLLVEKEAVGEACIAYAAQQVGARTYVWNTLGLQGDPNSSIAVLDSGIDASHIDFSPGYGDQDFSKKIVGWKDMIGSTTFPVDDLGHGSHCAGLAAGNGFFSVDASGRANATYSGNFTGASGKPNTGFMVNNSGTIALSFKWVSTGTANVSRLYLYKSGKSITSWTEVSSTTTPSNDTWHHLTFNVGSVPLDGYDIYHPAFSLTSGNGSLHVIMNMSWPYMPPADGFSAWTGIAPESKLVGVKVITPLPQAFIVLGNQLISGIQWIISNQIKYHITVASMSLGFSEARYENSTIDSAVVNLVNSGITTIISAGNEGISTTNTIYTPGSVDEVMTVAALNQFDGITSYSGRGGPSRYTGATMKPDIAAPGGSFQAVPLYSVDSNTNDAEGGFADVQPDDGAPMQGTSMSTPIIAGCAQVVIQAMGGFANWNWTRKQALQPKMIILMTATETYPNSRETYSSTYSPTLERGGKDVHEGYGRVNLDVAVDAVLKSYQVGSVATDTLGRPPKTSDISVLGQRLAWARNVQLTAGSIYNFSLNVPAGADYDLYLYNSTGTVYGEPAIKGCSANASAGATETFSITPSYSGTYYIVVKRATESTGSGNFTLTSSKIADANTSIYVTLNTLGLVNASNVVHYTQNGIAKNGSIVASKFSDNADIGTTLTVDNQIAVSATQRYVSTGTASFTVQSNPAIENVLIESPHPYTSSYNTTWTLTRPDATKMRVHFIYIRTELIDDRVYTLNNAETYFNWNSSNIDDYWSPWVYDTTLKVRLTSDADSVVGNGFAIDQLEWENPNAGNYTANFKTEYYLVVNSPYGTKGGEAWYENGTNAYASLTSDKVDHGNGTRRQFTHWSGDATGTNFTACDPIYMNASKTVIANWKTQYHLNVSSAHGNTSGTDWYDQNTNAYATVNSTTVPGTTGTRYVFTSWSGAASGNTSTSNPIIMDNPKTATANWKTQYNITVSSGHGAPTASNWTDQDATFTASVSSPSEIIANNSQWVCTGYNLDGGASQPSTNYTFANIQAPHTITFNWKQQFYLTVNSTHGSTSGHGWYDSGSTANAVLYNQTVSEGTGVQQNFTGWSGDALGTSLTSNNITMNSSKTATANWQTQYQVSFVVYPASYGTVMPSSSIWVNQGGSPLPISATPSSGYNFTSWNATTGITIANKQSNATTATITAPGTITATFIPEYTTPLALAVLLTAISLLAVVFKKKNLTKRHDNN